MKRLTEVIFSLSFSDNLIKARKRVRCSQQQLALRSGISQQAISKLENGKSSPSEYTMRQLASALNISIYDLLEDKIEPGNPLAYNIHQRIEKLSEPALIRLSDFLDGLEAGQDLSKNSM